MENNKENKARYFAQYYGQNYMSFDLINGRPSLSILVDHTSIRFFLEDNLYLYLTPLSSITNEDAIEVAKIIMPYRQTAIEKRKCRYINIAKDEIQLGISKGYWKVEAYQYLQSKGYALPFMGLSIDDLINYGWLKLKE